MSSCFGFVRPRGAPALRQEIDAMRARMDHWSADAGDTWLDGPVALGALLLQTNSRRPSEPVATDRECDLTIAGTLRLDNRAELAGAFGLAESEATSWSDARLVLRAYREWGEACVPRLFGDFAFAIWDGRRRQLVCARDPFGIRPFYYFSSPDLFAFGSEIKALLTLHDVDRSIDELWICDYFLNLPLERESTMYAKIRRLEPAHMLVVSSAGVHKRQYWEPDVHTEIRLANDDEYIEAFVERLTVAMDRALDADTNIGAELSGGLDSSAICAMAQPVLASRGRSLHAFSQVPAPGQAAIPVVDDGRDAIRQVTQHVGITRQTLLTGEGEGAVAAMDWVGRYCDEPPRYLLGLWNDLTYSAAAAAGIRVLLSGFGGNQAVTSDGVHRREELFLTRQWGTLWKDLRGGSQSALPLRPIAGLFVRNVVGGWWLRRQKSTQAFARKFPNRPLRDELHVKWQTHERALQYFRVYQATGSVRQCVAQQLAAPNHAFRLEFSDPATRSRRIEYRYPLFDRELIAFYIATPSHFKQRNGVGRYLFRRAMQGRLPETVQWASPRAAATPNSLERRKRDAAALRSRLEALSATSPVFEYVDKRKLAATFDLNLSRGKWPWAREGDLIKILLLDQKLRETADGHGHAR